MKKLLCLAAAVAVAALLTGCYTSPPAGRTPYASYAGDRASVNLAESVVAVRLSDASVKWQNLHVVLGAIINPRVRSVSTPSELTDIIRRAQSRMDARIVDLVTSAGTVSELASLKRQIAEAAQSVFAKAYSTWDKAADYEVEIVVTSIYVTDPSAGRPRPPRWFD